MWPTLNDLFGSSKPKFDTVSKLTTSHGTLTEEVDIANCFRNFFSGIDKELSSKIYNNGESIGDYMHNIRNHVHINGFNFQIVTSAESKTTIRKLRCTGPREDGLPMYIFIENANSIADIITYICNKSLWSGVFPKKLTKAAVVCIFKAGKRDDPAAYRPVSLLPCFSKILEKNCVHSTWEAFEGEWFFD